MVCRRGRGWLQRWQIDLEAFVVCCDSFWRLFQLCAIGQCCVRFTITINLSSLLGQRSLRIQRDLRSLCCLCFFLGLCRSAGLLSRSFIGSQLGGLLFGLCVGDGLFFSGFVECLRQSV